MGGVCARLRWEVACVDGVNEQETRALCAVGEGGEGATAGQV